MKKAFVTGSTGFLALNLIERLQSKEWEITALYLPGEDLKYLSRFNVKPVPGNILDYSSLLSAMSKGQDVVFHLAGDTSMWSKNAQRQYNVNVQGTANVCKAALEKGVTRFIYTSSSSAYGFHTERLTEKSSSNALSCGMNYNRTKYLAEQEVKKAVARGLYAVMLNPCNIIGPYDPGNWSQLIKNTCLNRLPGYPPGMGTFAHVRDIADAHISAVKNGRNGENYLLGGVEASFKEVINEIIRVTEMNLPLKEISKNKLKLATWFSSIQSFFTGKEPVLTYPKYKRLVGNLTCDDTKAVQELGFKTTSISEMVMDCYQWLQQENQL
ncbi:NAD-dependent epimerase/dehydratase family protein [bacterium]|nr:NAD-dependent epimerase/dehydratase family protein [bacterium]